jgi:hypothetical protein
VVESLRKEDNTMSYTKPEVAVLGSAVDVVEQLVKGSGSTDPGNTLISPAYDLDE